MKNRGITLIALIITIVVMLILAGATITLVFGENGLFGKTETAVDKWNKSAGNELNELDKTASFFDKYLENKIEPLKVEGKDLKTASGQNFQLVGINSHEIQYYGDFITKESIQYLKNELNMNILRIPVGVRGTNGYLNQPELNKTELSRILDLLIEENMYGIISWQIVLDENNDTNPATHKETAKELFGTMSDKYKDSPNVLYEICNEPNNVTWSQIATYANEVIPVIRSKAPNSVIIVGTPSRSQKLEQVVTPLAHENIMYAFHYYLTGNSSDGYLFEKLDAELARNLPFIVTEWGTTGSASDDPQKIYIEESDKLLAYMDDKNISWLAWSFSNADFVTPERGITGERGLLDASYTVGANINDHLTITGKLIKERTKSVSEVTGAIPKGEKVASKNGWSRGITAVSDGEGNSIPIPAGFYYVGGTKNTGVVISDKHADKNKGVDAVLEGNQFVFIPTDTVEYEKVNWDATSDFNTAYKDSVPETSFNDVLYKTMVNKYKGFYVGRYESSIPESRVGTWTIETVDKSRAEVAVVKKGKIVWNNITYTNARLASIKMYLAHKSENSIATGGSYFVISELQSGYTWDTMLKWIQSTPGNSSYVNNSISLGNYFGTLTGLTGQYSINNIYDIAGNVGERTTEETSAGVGVIRGGDYRSTNNKVSYRNASGSQAAYYGFRVVLYMY